MQEMAASEVEATCDLDVTIFLVEKSSMEEQDGSTSNKRRRTNIDPTQVAHGEEVGEVKVKVSRLRQCSTYFDTCMSERWAQSQLSSEMEFVLELHAEVQYYEDCFSRMHFLFKPMKTVADCMELLKVAAQIGFQDVIDMGVKCLAAAFWSDEEEKLVRDFCDTHLVPLDSVTELIARLNDIPVPAEAKVNKSSSFATNLLTDYLQCAIPGFIEGLSRIEAEEECYRLPICREMFESAFHFVVSGAELGVCASVVEHALNLLKQASFTLLSYLKENFYNDDDSPRYKSAKPLRIILLNFCWLLEIARKSNAAQTIVEVLLNDYHVSSIVRDFHFIHDASNFLSIREWDRMICFIFQDVLEGTLFLDTSQRVSLFDQWSWVLCDDISKVVKVHFTGLIARFITTLPLKKQVGFWKTSNFHYEHKAWLEAHTTWLSFMINGKVKRQLSGQQDRPTFESSSSEDD